MPYTKVRFTTYESDRAWHCQRISNAEKKILHYSRHEVLRKPKYPDHLHGSRLDYLVGTVVLVVVVAAAASIIFSIRENSKVLVHTMRKDTVDGPFCVNQDQPLLVSRLR